MRMKETIYGRQVSRPIRTIILVLANQSLQFPQCWTTGEKLTSIWCNLPLLNWRSTSYPILAGCAPPSPPLPYQPSCRIESLPSSLSSVTAASCWWILGGLWQSSGRNPYVFSGSWLFPRFRESTRGMDVWAIKTWCHTSRKSIKTWKKRNIEMFSWQKRQL